MKTKQFAILFLVAIATFFSSCSSDSSDGGGDGDGDGSNDLTSISVEVSSSVECGIYAGDTVSFAVTGNNGQDLTNQSTIMVNGNSISGNTYTTSESGSLQVTATYQSLTSGSLQVGVSEDHSKFTKHVLIEDYTGTWCGYCPRVSYAIELTKEQTDQIAVIAVHNDEEYYCDEVEALENAFNINAYPTVKVDRAADWTFPEPNNIDQVVNKTLCDNAPLGLTVIPTLNGNNVNVEVKVKFSEDFSFNNTKLVVMAVEDDLIANQENYTSYYGGVSVIQNFEHDHVLRASLTNVAGDAIPSNDILESVYSRTFSLSVPSNVTNASKLSFVAFVSNNNFTGAPYVVNARVGHFNEVQSFEEN
ncbi:Omp28-related outer membrane protein [Winogradskyella pulchriflava]|uniref:Omp28-related outer membrane protein n=1 Tax=Winogradskyella pulchriflava TaxID=1110688 RepID=A0ABV6Q6X9_9FLAO